MSFLDRIAAAVTPAASDEQRSETRQKAKKLASSEPWFDLILDQHEEIERLVQECLDASSAEARRSGLRQLATVLTAHANAEETVVYPDVAEFSGKTHAGMAYEEHAMTKVNLAKLEKIDPAADDWREKLSHIKSALQQHMYQEEDSWLPDLVENLPKEEKERMTQRFLEEHERYCRGAASTSSVMGSPSTTRQPQAHA